MNTIEQIIDRWDWKLKVFSSRYGSGFWVTLLPNIPYSDEIEEHITGGDMLAMPMINYLENEGVWLPTALASTLKEALDQVNIKVTILKEQPNWRDAVHDAVDELIEGDVSYSDIEFNSNLQTVLLQHSFVELLTKANIDNQMRTL